MGDLFPEELRLLLPPLYGQEKEEDPMVYVKFFHPNSHWTWYGCEYTEGLFFGFVYGDFPEMGYFSLKELETFTDFLGITVERDEHFTPHGFQGSRTPTIRCQENRPFGYPDGLFYLGYQQVCNATHYSNLHAPDASCASTVTSELPCPINSHIYTSWILRCEVFCKSP